MEPEMTHPASWLESTGECGVQPNKAGASSAQKSLLKKRTDNILFICNLD